MLHFFNTPEGHRTDINKKHGRLKNEPTMCGGTEGSRGVPSALPTTPSLDEGENSPPW